MQFFVKHDIIFLSGFWKLFNDFSSWGFHKNEKKVAFRNSLGLFLQFLEVKMGHFEIQSGDLVEDSNYESLELWRLG